MQNIKLNNGVEMPILGFGVYQITPEECESCVLDAINVGYRSIDTAQAYYNEQEVGNAISKCGIPREELFLTTKIWVSNAGYEKAKASIDESLRKLQTNYIDLLLIHQPVGDYYGTWRAMEEAYKNGKVRAIGVSNFYPDRFIDLAENSEIKPMVNQLQTHIFYQQWDAEKIMNDYETRLMAWAPLAEGKNNFFSNTTMSKIGNKYDKSVAQVALRYLIQRDIIVIPKSTHKNRMEENFNLFDFILEDKDMDAIKSLDLKDSLFPSHDNPELIKFILNYEKNHKPSNS